MTGYAWKALSLLLASALIVALAAPAALASGGARPLEASPAAGASAQPSPAPAGQDAAGQEAAPAGPPGAGASAGPGSGMPAEAPPGSGAAMPMLIGMLAILAAAAVWLMISLGKKEKNGK